MIRRASLRLASLILAVPVTLWAWHHERRIWRLGCALSPPEIDDARAAGVRDPARLRVLVVPSIPNPLQRFAGLIERWTRFSIFSPAGMTLRYGIFVVETMDGDRPLLTHEFVHTAQYERLGGRFRFLHRYVFECLAHGYLDAPLETEARELSSRICGFRSAAGPPADA